MFQDESKSKGNMQVGILFIYLFIYFNCLTSVVFRNNETLRVELAAFKKQNVLLMQEVELLKEQVGK